MIRGVFGIDLRALAGFRIGLAAVLLFDLCQRAGDLENHYTDFGLLVRENALKVLPENAFSIHLASGTFSFQAIIFLIAFVFALFYLIGYRTRLSSWVSIVLLISLQNRNTLILNNADTLLLACLFWSIFVPIHARYSVDALSSSPPSNESNPHFSIGGMALLIQAMAVYLFSFFHKTGAEWYPDGTALYYALNVGAYVSPMGVWFRESPYILKAMTFGTLGLELIGPLLIFTPLFRVPLRLLVISLFAMFNLGIFTFMDLGFFPMISLVALIPFIPKECWNMLEKWWRLDRQSYPSMKGQGEVSQSLNIFKVSPVKNLIASGALILILMWNIATLPQTGFKLPGFINGTLTFLRMNQFWDMFAPYPYKASGWYSIPGELRNGQQVDVYKKKKGEASLERPEYLSKTYKNERWRKYLINMRTRDDDEIHLLNYGRFLCRSWNRDASFEDQLMTFDIYYTEEKTQPNYKKPVTTERIIWTHQCFGS